MRISDWSSDVCSSDLQGSEAKNATLKTLDEGALVERVPCKRHYIRDDQQPDHRHRHSTQCSYDQIHVHALSPPDERTTPNQVCSSNVYGERVNERKVRLLRAASCSTLGPNRLHLRPPFLPPARHRVAHRAGVDIGTRNERKSTRLNSSH